MGPSAPLHRAAAVGARRAPASPGPTAAPRRAADISHPPALSRLLQRVVTERKAQAMLSTVLTDHEREDWYKANWNGAARVLASEVANLEDTTSDNVRSRFQGHATLDPILRPYRMTLEFGGREAFDDAGLQEVYDAYRELLFFHVSKAAPAVRSSGLDPDFGGKEGGIADERSVGDKRAHNVAQSKGKSFVTRKISEARQYMATGADMIQLLIPKAQQAKLRVDPDSMFGLYFQNDADFKAIKGVDRHSRDLSWWAYSYLAAEVSTETQRRLPELVAELRRRGTFFESRPEDVVDIADFVAPTMSEEAAMAKARLVYG